MKPHVKHLYIDEQSKDAALTARIVSHYTDADTHIVPAIEANRIAHDSGNSPGTTLCIAHYRGKFIKSFPTHPW